MTSPSTSPDASPGPASFTVLTLNSYLCRVFGRDLSPDIARRVELIRGELARLSPEVICLQEVWSAELAARLLDGLPAHHAVHVDTRSRRAPMGSGLWIFTRHPVKQIEFRPLPWTGRPKEMLARRGVLIAHLEVAGYPMRVCTTHLGLGLSPGRRRQHRAMVEALPGGDIPAIICGDFNLAPIEAGPLMPLFDDLAGRGFRDSMREIHGDASDTMYTADYQVNPLVHRRVRLRIDHLWYRPGADHEMELVEADLALHRRIDGQFPSDHFAVAARFQLARQVQ